MALSSVSVLANALRLRRWRCPARRGEDARRRRRRGARHEHRRGRGGLGRLGEDDPLLRDASACCNRAAPRARTATASTTSTTSTTLRFIRRAREPRLLGRRDRRSCWRCGATPRAPSREVKRIAARHIARPRGPDRRDAGHGRTLEHLARALPRRRPSGLPDPGGDRRRSRRGRAGGREPRRAERAHALAQPRGLKAAPAFRAGARGSRSTPPRDRARRPLRPSPARPRRRTGTRTAPA